MKAAALLLTLALAAFADSPKIVYMKEFKGSVPAWVEITLERDGAAVYKESPTDDYPLKFKLTGDDVNEVFRLADTLDRFSRPLESNLKVAFMGTKTLRFMDGSTRNEVKFNYSLDENARTPADWFERMIESEQHYIRLERAVKYDKLGVNEALLLLQVSYEKKRVVGSDQYLPLLDRVAKNDTYLHMARERAAAMADSIRGVKPPSE